MSEDAVPEKYKYAWTPESAGELSLEEFVKKYKPSMVENDGTKPWIWVRRSDGMRDEEGGKEAALEEGTAILDALTARVEEIKDDASIPARASKKTGAKGKKEVREEAQAEATEKLKDVAVRNGFVSGKWLSFASGERVDQIWQSLAVSIIEGPLSKTSAFGAKVATSGGSPQHLICVYVPDVYDKAAVTEVMKVLLKDHGFALSGVKSNLYTMLGIDSKHPSGIPSTTWKNAAILPDSEAKVLREQFFEGLSAAKEEKAVAKKVEKEKTGNEEGDTAKAKPKPQLKKKQPDNDDPFASGSEDDVDEKDEEVKRKEVLKKKAAPAPPKKKQAKSESDEDEDEPPKKKKAAPAPKKKQAKSESDEDEDEDEAPRKKKPVSKKKPAPAPKKKRAKSESDDDDEDDEPPKKRKSAKK